MTTQEIWESFSGPLRSFIRRRVADPTDAEDVLQEVFVRLHAGLGGLRDAERLAPWLYRIARNALADHARARRNRKMTPLPEALEAVPMRRPGEEIASSLRGMVGCLPPTYREAVLLSELEGLPQREVARRLGLSLSGAKSRVQRGREMLRVALLDCCHFEFDRVGRIIDYSPRADCCRSHSS